MQLTDKISIAIKQQIEQFEKGMIEVEIGHVVTVGDGVAMVSGLYSVMLNELIRFRPNVYGIAMNLEVDLVGVVLLGSDAEIKAGDEVYRTGRVMEVPVGDSLLGRVVNAMGEAIDGKEPIQTNRFRPIEQLAPGVMARKSIHEPLQTGIKMIDSMIPIGKGQRELIIGDRQTGKTAIAIDTIINQKKENINCVYVAIGQKAATVAQIVEKLKEHDAMDYTTVVFASASEASTMLYIAPYAGCAMAEEWMEQGKDVLIIYDDLSKHAVAYRTMSLLLRRPPGREAYPGDVFYLHSRLLERSGKLNEENGGGSMTALPIIETLDGDISGYIPTNVISITDGQIFFQTELFNAGARPAIDVGLSVSRVGGAAQTQAMKRVARTLKLDLAQYNELLAFSQFGSDIDYNTKLILHYGEALSELMKQAQYKPLSLSKQVISLFLASKGYINRIATEQLQEFVDDLLLHIRIEYREILNEIDLKKELDDNLEQKLVAVIDSFVEHFEVLLEQV